MSAADAAQHSSSTSNEKKILVINCGSSSLKYEVWGMPRRTSLGRGTVERIGELKGRISQKTPRSDYTREIQVPHHKAAMELVREALTDPGKGVVSDLGEIAGVGHRVVHGGEQYAASVIIDEGVLAAIEKNVELAPLHNPPNLIGIKEAQAILPDTRQVAVFDTAFHQTMPPAAFLYGLPYELYEKYKIRRYGFHGTSHRYVAGRAMELLRRDPQNTNVITCHLGNGASVTAIEHGRSIDTSMGFTPLEGLMMGTRSGDIDPAIIDFLTRRGYSAPEVNSLLNKKSGLLGLSGISNDLRDLEDEAARGNPRAQQALEVYAYRVRKYVGAYVANLVKVDALVFTGGIGQNGVKMRERICHRLENLGIFMDYGLNASVASSEGIVSAPFSPIAILVVQTNEELQIAMDTYDLIFGADASYRRRRSDVTI
ncbi:MAG TPA: acetate kinase [Spirochaetia bacterium]|nr:acetate kinase [Spirochaetia bacterium]